jgi:hypothetical protein
MDLERQGAVSVHALQLWRIIITKGPDIRDRQNDEFHVTRPLVAPKRENDKRLLKGI